MRTTQDEVDLGLALGLSNYRAEADEIGAGVNALAASPSDPTVSELVWSPHTGLSLKCTTMGPKSSNCREKPSILWNVGHDDQEEDGHLRPVMVDNSDRDLVAGENSREADEEAATSNQVLADANVESEVVAESNSVADGKGDMDMDAKFSCKPLARKCLGGKAKINACKRDVMGLNVESLRHRASKISEDLAYSLPNIIENREEEEEEEADEEVTSSNKNNEVIIPEYSPVPIDAIPLDNVDCSAEKDLAANDSPERIHEKDVKGKGKVMSERDDEQERLLEYDDGREDSNESVESCNNNVGFFSKGAKRDNGYDEETSYCGSKRAKKELAKGSFANWMSTMVKGLAFGNNHKEDRRSFPLSLALARSNDFTSNKTRHDYGGKGFKKVFQSLYCQTKSLDRKEGYFIEEPDEEANAFEPKLIENRPLDGNGSQMQIILPNEERNSSRKISDKPSESFSSESNCASLAREGDLGKSKVSGSDSLFRPPCNNNQGEGSNLKCNGHTSLWITRFCSRNVALDRHGDEISKEGDHNGQKTTPENEDGEEASFCFRATTTSRISPLVRFQKARCPDEMASTFMRRLDALRQSSLLSRQLSDGRGKENISNYDVRDRENNNDNILDYSNGIRKGDGDSNFKWIRQKDERRSEFMATPEMFLAISKLWLSRSDILRWMNSNTSTNYLSGFFLRLRLGKSEEGMGGETTGYYVACITTGDARKHSNGLKPYKKSVVVDVGGIKTCIESQYISNHNFLEDEIKAWWCKTVKTGGEIPSLHELNSKFEDRKHLGFN